jgi:hypothetical protein
MRYVLIGLLLFINGHGVLADKSCPDGLPAHCCKEKCRSWWSRGWATTLYAGPLTSQTTSKIFSDPDFGNSGIVALAGSKELGTVLEKRLGFELETQLVQHFGDQRNFEFNPIVFIARWKQFPWNETMPTTFAIGDGISIASEKPKLEVKRRGSHDTSQTLNYVMAEATFSHPCYRQWAFVLRYHHRSGMFGTFNGVHDASTAFAAGVKYWF